MMKRFSTPVVLLLTFLFVLSVTVVSSVTEARAQNTTYVASYGSDANACGLTTPCLTFSRAYNQTSARGTIVCLNTVSDDGLLSVIKPLTIECDGSSLFFLSIFVSPVDQVVVRGLSIRSSLSIGNGGTVVLNRLSIGSGTPTSGISVTPSGALRLAVSDSVITASNTSSTGAGILVKPSSGGSAQVALERVSVNGNAFGVAFDGSDSSGGINATISDSTISANRQDGIVATTQAGKAPIGVMVKNSKSANNAFGIRAIGPSVTVRVDGSSITGNGIGLAVSGGGALLSAGNNIVEANGANGAFTSSLVLK
jgi:hypothetical protein